MLLRPKIEPRLLPPAADFDIGGFVGADRHVGRGNIRDRSEGLVEAFSRLVRHRTSCCCYIALQPTHFGHQSSETGFVLRGLCLTYFLGDFVATLLRVLRNLNSSLSFII